MYLISLRTFVFFKSIYFVLSSSISFDKCGNNDTIFLSAKNIRIEKMFGESGWNETSKVTNEITCRSLCHIETRCRSAIFNLQNQSCLMQDFNRFSPNIKIKQAPGNKLYDKRTCNVSSEGGFTGLVADAVDCKDIKDKGWKTNGVYGISVTGEDDTYQTISCEMSLLGGGWTVIQRRVDASVSFEKTWTEYKQGFGDDLVRNLWNGNERIHKLTWGNKNDALFELHLPDGRKFYPMYDEFKVDKENNNYTVGYRVETNYGDSADYTRYANLEYHNQQPFSTKDRPRNYCNDKYFGGWWFATCHYVYLNGIYGGNTFNGIGWDSIVYYNNVIPSTYVSMMIRKK